MKLDRAKLRMKELEELIQSFRATEPYKFSRKPDPQYAVKFSMDKVTPVPDEIPLVAGDILQNPAERFRSIGLSALSARW